MSGPDVVVCAIDYDGCFAPECGRSKLKLENLVASIIDLYDKHPRSELRLILGSYRQSLDLDAYYWERNNNGSAFLGLRNLLAEIQKKIPNSNAKIIPFLLADIAQKQKIGTNFTKALSLVSGDHVAVRPYGYKENGDFRWVNQSGNARLKNSAQCFKAINNIYWHDGGKRSLTYAQIHYLAAQYSKEKIQYHFFDDALTSVLVPLQDYYQQRLHFIPANVRVQFHHFENGTYDENLASHFVMLNGHGFVDYDFIENVISQKIECREERKIIKSAAIELSQSLENRRNYLALTLYDVAREDWLLANENAKKIDKVYSIDEVIETLKKIIKAKQYQLGVTLLKKIDGYQESYYSHLAFIESSFLSVSKNEVLNKLNWVAFLKSYLLDLKSNRDVNYPLEILILLLNQQLGDIPSLNIIREVRSFFENMVVSHGYMRTNEQRFIDHAICELLNQVCSLYKNQAVTQPTQKNRQFSFEEVINNYLAKSTGSNESHERSRRYSFEALKVALNCLIADFSVDQIVALWRCFPSYQRGINCRELVEAGDGSFCCFWKNETADAKFIRTLSKRLLEKKQSCAVKMIS